MKPLTAAVIVELLALANGIMLAFTFLRRRRDGQPTANLRPISLALLGLAALGAVAVVYYAFA